MASSDYEKKPSYSRELKHYCPDCCEPLKAITVGNTLNSESPKKSNGLLYGGTGSMKSYRTEFQCPKCRLRYSLEDLKKK
jgi:hypothetical protein